MASLNRRIKDLEEGRWPDRSQDPPWVFEDRIDAVLSKIRVHQMGSAPDKTSAYQYTDFEITTLGVIVAQDELVLDGKLRGGQGFHEFPSGAAVRLRDNPDNEDSLLADISGRIEPEDLPAHMRPYVARMPADKQLEHEWFWYERWRTRHERETYEELHARFQVSRLRGSLEHLDMLESSGLWRGGSPEAHAASRQRVLRELEEWTATASAHEAARLSLRPSQGS